MAGSSAAAPLLLRVLRQAGEAALSQASAAEDHSHGSPPPQAPDLLRPLVHVREPSGHRLELSIPICWHWDSTAAVLPTLLESDSAAAISLSTHPISLPPCLWSAEVPYA